MSCSICLLPFVPASRSIAPRPPPPGVLSPQQDTYLRTAYGLGTRVMGTIGKYEYLDNNMFGNKAMIFISWEGEGGTFLMMHATCAHILRRIFGAEARSNEAGLVRLCEIEEVLGRPQAGINASRLPFILYEEIGDPADRVDIRPFWQRGTEPGLNVFLWREFAQSDAKWALAKPDVFPRFYPQVKPERLTAISTPVRQPGILTQQPLDVLLALLPHLPLTTYIALAATCRVIRRHALTTFQPHTRMRVLELGWATPLLALGEYSAAIKRNPNAAQLLVHPELSPPTGDWLLYLSHVHRTASMRARRRIWNICTEVLRVVTERLPSSTYGQNLEVERAKLETNVGMVSRTMKELRAMDDASLQKMAEEMIPGDHWQTMSLNTIMNGAPFEL